MTGPSPDSGEREPLTLDQFADDTNDAIEFADWALDALEDRISRIEEIIAARWPRSMFLRRRLARELRTSVAATAWAAPDFAGRRAEWAAGHLGGESIGLRGSRRQE